LISSEALDFKPHMTSIAEESQMMAGSESSGTYTAYIDKNHPGDAPVLTVVMHIHGTTSIVLPKTLGEGDLATAKSEADRTIEDGGFERVGDWKVEDQYRLSAAVERKTG
jgi:hypothetical protein